jgi:hypothetical protein
VHRVPGAYEERSPQRARWGAVVVGLFLAWAASLLVAQASAQWPRPERPGPSPRTTHAAWYAFAGACVSLVAALLGGAVGAAGLRDGRRFVGRDPGDEQRLRERDREARRQDVAGRGDPSGRV